MSRPIIEKLPIELSNLIAAGEVVERPASVVKELVENSIDAFANVVRIDLIDYGLKKITIIDNGIGMSEDEISLAVLPHATSKIKSKDDLFSINTLGFRGEAIPSINSVSKMQITSSIDGYNGVCKSYKAGECYQTKNVSFTKGTMIEISDLFFNTPARLKHLSSPQIELSHIISFVNRCALANRNISFTLSNNGKIIFSTSGDDDCKMIIRNIYGLDVAKNMLEFSNSNGIYQINGFTSSNSVFRSNRNSISVIVNKRVIKNLSLTYAITDAYKTYLPIGKYPITILYITADESLVDVNVHPTKQEVRFTDEYNLKELVAKTIIDCLKKVELVYSQNLESSADIITSEKNVVLNKSIVLEKKDDYKNFNTQSKSYEWNDFIPSKPVVNIIEEQNDLSNDSDTFSYEINNGSYQNMEKTDIDINYKKEVVEQVSFEFRDEENKFFSSMNYIGQYNKTYLLLEKDDNLYLLDQHAGMERYMYELIKKEFANDKVLTTELIIPIKIEIPLYEIELVLNKKDEFVKLGIDYDYFGSNVLLIRKIPTWIPEKLKEEFISDIINYIVNNQKITKEILKDNLAKMLSCKKSIKANMNILDLEVKTLLEKLDMCVNPFTCPHGRPTIIKFSKYEIEKLFKRVI